MYRIDRMSCTTSLIASALVITCAGVPAQAELMVGPCARAMFDAYLDEVGGTYESFDGLPTGTNLTTQLAGCSFASISDVAGNPAGPHHVEVSNATWGPNKIVGSPCDPFCVDDGRVRYEIVFDTPQRWAGVLRTWSENAKTEFYNEAGALLGEHIKTESSHEYAGYVAETDDPSGWVKRIEIDSVDLPYRQVGYTDDLIYGTGDVSAVTDPCPLDIDCNGELDFDDLLVMLSVWGDACTDCRADLNGDGAIGFNDLLVLLANWGPCS